MRAISQAPRRRLWHHAALPHIVSANVGGYLMTATTLRWLAFLVHAVTVLTVAFGSLGA